MSRVRVISVDAKGLETAHAVFFNKEDEEVEKNKKSAAKLVEEYVKRASDARQQMLYKPSPMLHKSVYSTIVGVDGRGYCLMHDIMNRKSYLGFEAMEDLFSAAVSSDCCHDKNDVAVFLSNASRPCVAAAQQGAYGSRESSKYLHVCSKLVILTPISAHIHKLYISRWRSLSVLLDSRFVASCRETCLRASGSHCGQRHQLGGEHAHVVPRRRPQRRHGHRLRVPGSRELERAGAA